jgi:uncharacterized protein involved in outer membrane biogenesis
LGPVAEVTSKGDGPPPRRWRRVAVGVGLGFAVVLTLATGAFLWGVAIPGELLRAPLERALTAAFGVPARIEGPLTVRTGLTAVATADALALADPAGTPGATLARGIRPAAAIDLLALARRAVVLQEVTGERLELTLVRRADGHANWAPIFAASPGSGPPAVTFDGITRLRIGSVTGSYRSEGGEPTPFAIAGLDGALPLRVPATARGTATIAGHAVPFELRTASLAGLQAAGAPIPVHGTLDWSGARVTVDGSVAGDGSKLDAGVGIAADDASQPLAALGIAARAPGKIDAHARVGVTASEAVASDLAVTLGASALSGSARVSWGGPHPRIAIDVDGQRVDLAPFLAAATTAKARTPAEAFVGLLEAAATGFDAEVKLALRALDGLPVTLRELELDGRSGDERIEMRGVAVIAGTATKATLDYDARKPQRVLAARLDSGAVSTARLPGGERPRAFSGTSRGLRGELRGQGADPRAIVASLDARLEARDLRWTLAGRDGHPVSGRFDTVRISLQGTRASSVEVAGKLGDATCMIKASGGALAPLLEGERWPVQFSGSCPGGRLSAKGRVALVGERVVADLGFDASATRIGPIAQALGVSRDAPHPFAARGTFALDETLARARFIALRLGRTAGSGDVAFPLGAGGTPRVRLALTTADLDEINALAGPARMPSEPLEREVLRKNLRLPDVGFDIAADRVAVADMTLRRLRSSGAVRASRLQPSKFSFEWGAAQVSGTLAADFSGTAPRAELDATAQNADLGALLARLGAAGVGLHADRLSLRTRAQGSRLGELLAGATIDATIERGRFELARAPAPGLEGRGEFSATLKAAPGRPATLAARGTMAGEPFDLAFDTPGLASLLRAGEPIPATLKLALGDAQLQATGTVGRDGTGQGRVRISGARLDRLGKLIGTTLPEVGPYAANGAVATTRDTVRASEVDVSFGQSRLHGQVDVQVRRTGRPLHSATLRAPMLHLEDLGAARWLGGPGGPKVGAAGEAPAAQLREAEIARALELLRTADIDATIEVDALHGGAERFASGRLRATLEGGALRVLLQDVRTEGGAVDADLRIDASGAQPKFTARARVDGLDFGPLARTLDPATKLGGRLDLVADLAAQGSPGRLLPALGGKIDVAVFPHDLRSEALAFWGTGLLSSMLRTLDPNTRSEVECAVASLDIDAGVASTSALFVDTTRVRIIGQIDANLMTRALSGRIRPRSEQPELFTVAPTMVVGGSIESPRLTVAPENVVFAPLRFATPLARFAIDFLSSKGKLREGVAGCREAFDRARALHPAVGGAK